MSDLNPTDVTVLPAPRPDPALVLDPAGLPSDAPQEQVLHCAQIYNRPVKLSKSMMPYAAFAVNPGSGGLAWTDPVAPVGTFTYWVLSRHWARTVHRSGRTPAIVFRGYRSRVEDGKVVIGGVDGSVCAYDLRFRPLEHAHPAGRIMSTGDGETLRIGLALDKAVEHVVKAVRPVDPGITLPTYWCAFNPDDMPPAEDCPAVRRWAMLAVRPDYDGPTLPSLRSPGATVTSVVRFADDDHLGEERRAWAVGFGGTADSPDAYRILPRSAQLRPYCRVGAFITAGTPIADLVPRRTYPNVRKIGELYGEDVAARLVEEVSSMYDRDYGGLRLRRAEFCPSAIGKAVRVYEDASPLVGKDANCRIQVVGVRNGGAGLSVSRDGAVAGDLWSIKKEWEPYFEFCGEEYRGQTQTREVGATQ